MTMRNFELQRAGARGYLLKSDAWYELVTAVRTVNGEQRYVSQGLPTHRDRRQRNGTSRRRWIVLKS
jgi:DNA-binding NarL/FixJ family response regulator